MAEPQSPVPENNPNTAAPPPNAYHEEPMWQYASRKYFEHQAIRNRMALNTAKQFWNGLWAGLKKLAEPQDWLRAQQMNWRQASEGERATPDQRAVLVWSLMNNERSPVESSSRGFMSYPSLAPGIEDVDNDGLDPKDLYWAGVPFATGMDLDPVAIQNAWQSPQGRAELMDTATALLFGDRGPENTERTALIEKYFNLDPKNWLARLSIDGFFADTYDDQGNYSGGITERALQDDVVRVNAFNPVSEYEFNENFYFPAKAILGEALYDKLRQMSVSPFEILSPEGQSFVETLDSNTAVGIDDPSKWYNPDMGSLAAITEVLFNDPFTLVDVGIDGLMVGSRAVRAARGAKPGDEWITNVKHIANTDEIQSYHINRAHFIDNYIDKQRKTLETEPTSAQLLEWHRAASEEYGDFTSWRHDRQMAELETGLGIISRNHPELREIEAQYLQAVRNDASNDELRAIRANWVEAETKLRKLVETHSLPFQSYYNSLEELASTMESNLELTQLASESVNLPSAVVAHSYLMKNSPRYNRAVRVDDTDVFQPLLNRTAVRVDNLRNRTMQTQAQMTEMRTQIDNLRYQVVRYDAVKEAVISRFGYDHAAENMRWIFAELMANNRSVDQVIDEAVDVARNRPVRRSALTTSPQTIGEIHPAEIKTFNLEQLRHNPDTKEYYRSLQGEPAASLIDPVGGLDSYIRGRGEPYFRNEQLRYLGLDHAAAERQMLDWAENFSNEYGDILELTGRRLGGLGPQQELPNTIGKIIRMEENVSDELLAEVAVFRGRDADGNTITTPITSQHLEEASAKANRTVNLRLEKLDATLEELNASYDNILAGMEKWDKVYTPAQLKRLAVIEQYSAGLKSQIAGTIRLNQSGEGADTPAIQRLRQELSVLHREKQGIIEEGLKSGTKYHSKEGRVLRQRAQTLLRDIQEAEATQRRILRDQKTPIQALREIYGDRLEIDYETLIRRSIGRDASPEELAKVGRTRDLVEDLWKQVLEIDPDLLKIAGDDRSLFNLVRTLSANDNVVSRGYISRRNAFNPAVKAGEINNYNIGEALNYVVHEVNRRIHMKPVSNKIDLMVRNAENMGDYDTANYYRVLSNRLNGRPNQFDEFFQAAWYKGVSSIPNPWLRDTLLRHQVLSPTKMALGFMRGAYIGYLTGNLGFVIKNLTGMGNTTAHFGHFNTIRGFATYSHDPIDLHKLAGLNVDIQDFYGGAQTTYSKLVDNALKANAVPENILRGTAMYTAMDQTMLDWYAKGLIKERSWDAVREAGLMDQLYRQGLDAAYETQHIYSMFGRVISGKQDLWNSTLLRPFQQFINFWGRQTGFGLRMIDNKEFGKMARWLAVTGEMIRVGEQLGIDATEFTPASYGGPAVTSPAFSVLQNLGGAMGLWSSTPEEQAQYARDLANDLMTVAGGYAGLPVLGARRAIKGIQEQDTPIVFTESGGVSHYADAREKLYRIIGLPPEGNRQRREIFLLGRELELQKSSGRLRTKHLITDFIRRNTDENNRVVASDFERGILQQAIRSVSEQSGYILTDAQIDAWMEKGIMPKTFMRDRILETEKGRYQFERANRRFLEERGATRGHQTTLLTNLLRPNVATVLSQAGIVTQEDMYNYRIAPENGQRAADNAAFALGVSRRHVRYRSGQIDVYNLETDSWVPCPPNTLGGVIYAIEKSKENRSE